MKDNPGYVIIFTVQSMRVTAAVMTRSLSAIATMNVTVITGIKIMAIIMANVKEEEINAAVIATRVIAETTVVDMAIKAETMDADMVTKVEIVDMATMEITKINLILNKTAPANPGLFCF